MTYGKPEARVDYLDNPKYGWTVEHVVVKKPNETNYHHVYTMTKHNENELSSCTDFVNTCDE
jgi:hypothetical protein